MRNAGDTLEVAWILARCKSHFLKEVNDIFPMIMYL